ncbi:hypothetical protein Tco_0436452 [Tanacetum coccineum]
MTMKEYVQYETEKALRNGKVYNWETATYGKIRYVDDINDRRFFKIKFPTIVYDDALTSELEFSSEPMVSPQHVDEVHWKIETSLSKFDDEKYEIIYDNDLFSYKIFPVNDLKLDMGNSDDKIDIKLFSEDKPIELSHNVISIDVDTYAQGSNKILETSHDAISKFFTTETFIKELNVNIMIWNYFNEGMLINLIKNLYLPFGIPFDPKLFYKDETKAGARLT